MMHKVSVAKYEPIKAYYKSENSNRKDNVTLGQTHISWMHYVGHYLEAICVLSINVIIIFVWAPIYKLGTCSVI